MLSLRAVTPGTCPSILPGTSRVMSSLTGHSRHRLRRPVRHPQLPYHLADKRQIHHTVRSPSDTFVKELGDPALKIGHNLVSGRLGVSVEPRLEMIEIGRKPVVGILVKGKTPPSDACIDNFFHNILGFAIIFPLQRYK